MKKLVFLLAVLAAAGAMAGAALAGDTLAGVRKKGVLVCGVKASSPPFGYVDPMRREIVGYDIDFGKAIAKKLGVRLELKAVAPGNRVAHLLEGKVDMIAATMTKTPERALRIDFSDTYFSTSQKFLIRKGTARSLKDLEGKKIGTAKGATAELNVKKAVPSAAVLTFDDYRQAFTALQRGKIFALATDEPILAGLLAKAWNKEKFEIPDIRIADELYGFGIRKGNADFVAFVNGTIAEMEESGEAKRIFDKWFGPKSDTPMARNFKIAPGK